MPVVWRIAQQQFATLDGTGGLYTSGRWHSKGRQIIYTAEAESLALLELLVHFERTNPPRDLVLMKIAIPDHTIHLVDYGRLPLKSIYSAQETQAYGNRWLQEKSSLALCVPSILAHTEHNYIINPEHPDFDSIRIVDKQELVVDRRLLQGSC